MKNRIDEFLQRQLGRAIPCRREWFHSSPGKPARQVEWHWLGRTFLKIDHA